MVKRYFLHTCMGGSKNGGTQQPWVFLLKMIVLGCFGGTTILGNPRIVRGISVSFFSHLPGGFSIGFHSRMQR